MVDLNKEVSTERIKSIGVRIGDDTGKLSIMFTILLLKSYTFFIISIFYVLEAENRYRRGFVNGFKA